MLRVSLGQHSVAGRKDINQDFHGAAIPKEPLLSSKGIVVAIADGIEVAKAGMVTNEVSFDSTAGIIVMRPGVVVDVGLQLTNDKAKEIVLVALDAQTDAELGRTAAIPVKLGV